MNRKVNTILCPDPDWPELIRAGLVVRTRCRDTFLPAVTFFPAMSKTVIFAVDFVINVFCVDRISAVCRPYTHSHTHIFVCRSADKRHFFRCSANKVAPGPGGYSQSCDFRGFSDHKCGQNRHCVTHIIYIGSIHTHSHTRIFVCRSAINVTFCE